VTLRRLRLGVSAGTLALACASFAAAAPALAPVSGSAVSAETPPILNDEDELILEVTTAKAVISDGVLGYRTPRGVYLPLGDFTRAIDLAVQVDAATGRAQGWFLSESRAFRLDLAGREAVANGRRFSIEPGDVAVKGGELYVRAPLIAQWFPLDLIIDTATQQVRVRTRETFPFEARLARQQARERAGAAGAGAGRPKPPRELAPYALATPPSVDLAVRAAAKSGGPADTQYNVRASGDLLLMSANLYLAGDRTQALSDARLSLGRKDPDGGLLGPLKATQAEFGDTWSARLPLGPALAAGRGVLITDAPLERVSVFSHTDVRGEVTAGWEVELYRNNVLIGSQAAADGRYAFEDVPLGFGPNELRLVFLGPHGERREEIRHMTVGDGRLRAGETRFVGSAVQQNTNLFGVRPAAAAHDPDDGRWRVAASAEYGLFSALTVGAGAASFTRQGQRRNMALATARTGVGNTALALDAATQDGGASALQFGLAGRGLGGVSYSLRHAEYRGDFADENRLSDSAFRRATQLRLDQALRLKTPGGGVLPLSNSLTADYGERADGLIETRALLRTGTSTGRWLVTHTFDYTREQGAGADRSALAGSVQADGRLGAAAVRANLEYGLTPDPELRAVAVAVERRVNEDLTGRFGVSQTLSGRQGATLNLSVARGFRRFDLALDGQYETASRSLLLGVRFGTSFGWSPTRKGWFQDRPGLARGGTLEARVFQDLNGDGRRQPDEPALSDVELGGGGRAAATGRDGVARLANLGDGRPAQVALNGAKIDDPYLQPVRDGVELVPRPGRIQVVDFPVAAVAEVEGEAMVASGEERRGVGGVALQLVDATGRVVATARTEFDGRYVFERVPAGRFTVRLDPEQQARLPVQLEAIRPVAVGAAGGVVSAGRLLLVAPRLLDAKAADTAG
jgi:hypothetical protein